ncbi:tyrosine-type recombinase/integrase [Ectothiorhodospira variabilis]|uniref:tyrosine-type recombinase/integrase n=1 Tax=Ectothiorhodospira variabilis TaxID=505694 RepID=UPI001EFADD53|nr:integrase arm-type DNA-binding domain-containing protein [Ectothiorhodospira variabilis]MCG5495643.1 integrase arm-type DNA-binding domain-containing protein [Ectothiorhodospira variabilis]MCG5504704.1 integrase arm-type DNA-binding domain-containing protein [Ectothiorhodospira variabilis]MCG5507861.1 integrase arm-type DNA-binding domain-containing protein [Ectothiorhodospira variabilis]
MPANKLTATQVRQAKPSERAYKLHDGQGLSLRVRPSGKEWLFRFKYQGRSRETILGKHPPMTLADARLCRDEARALLKQGIDPIVHRSEQREAAARAALERGITLADMLRGWLSDQRWTDATRSRVTGRLERHIIQPLGHRPIKEITAPELLAVLRLVEQTGGVETARRAKQAVARAYTAAIAAGQASHNPAQGLEVAMAPKPRPRHFAAITDPARLGELLRAIGGFTGQPQVMAALRLLPMLMVRPGELRGMEWGELDMGAALWTIPEHKMKMRRPHLVPLSPQAVEILEGLRPWTGHRRLVFPGVRTAERSISDATLTAALRRLGFGADEITPHGFRATARTLLDEVLKYRPDYVEHQLAHAVRDANGRAYNRTSFLAERREMMQAWADYLDGLKAEKTGNAQSPD